jgi:hypothetical protein
MGTVRDDVLKIEGWGVATYPSGKVGKARHFWRVFSDGVRRSLCGKKVGEPPRAGGIGSHACERCESRHDALGKSGALVERPQGVASGS